MTEALPGVVGVPEMTPVAELIERPSGRPVADQVRVAPDWESVAEAVRLVIAVPVTLFWSSIDETLTELWVAHVKFVVP